MPTSDMAFLDLGPRPWIVGHRGAAGSALENTLAAIRCAVHEGADMIEVDIQLTSDHVPVLFHDWDLRRLAGRSEIVERTSLELLGEIDLTSPIDRTRHSISTLEEALEVIPTGLPLNLEIKRRFHDLDASMNALRSVLDLDRPLLVSSFDWNLLAAIRQYWPELPIAPIGRFKPEALLQAADDLGAFSIHAHRELAPQILALGEGLTRPVLGYTVNDPDEARDLLGQGIAGLFSDFPDRLRGAVEDDA